MEHSDEPKPTPNTAANAANRRRDRNRARAQAHSAEAVPASPPEPTHSGEVMAIFKSMQYDEAQLWAVDYANTNLSLFGNTEIIDYKSDDNNDVLLDSDGRTSRENTKQTEVPLSDTFKNLVESRTKLSEISVSLRNGKTFSTTKGRQDDLHIAGAKYQSARRAAAEELITSLPDDVTTVQKQALLAEFGAREDGALIGEEANYYLDRQNTRFQRSLEWYRERSHKEKIVIAIGGAAVIGAIGIVSGVVGGAAAGGVIGARFGRGYFKREASRKNNRTLLQKQQDASLRTSSHDEFVVSSIALRTAQDEQLLDTFSNQSIDRMSNNNDYLDEAKQESAAKRKSLYWAAGGIAVGASLGYALDHLDMPDLFGNNSDVDSSGIDDPEVDSPDPSDIPSTDANEKLDALQDEHQRLLEEKAQLLQEKADLLQQQNEALQDQLEAAATAAQEAASAEAQQLFGEFAGDTVSLDIPTGSNLWDQLELQVDQQNPFTSFEEKQRLVGNMLTVLQEQNPGRDFSLVYAGEHFDIVLPS